MHIRFKDKCSSCMDIAWKEKNGGITMKKAIALLLALVMVFALCACGGGGDSASGEKVVKIGVFEPASGNSGAGGKKEMLGMQYANQKTPTVEIGGETYKVELVYSDNASDPAKAVSAASKLVNEKVSIVLGSYGSNVSMAASDTFKQAGIPAIGVTCTNPNVTIGNSHYFRICYTDPFQGTVLANYASELGAKKAYCLGENGNEYDQGLITYFKQAFEKAGGTVVTDSFPQDNSDFSSYLNKAKDQGCGVFFAPVSIAYSTQIVSQANSLNVDIPILGPDTWDDNMVLNAANGTKDKISVTTFYIEGGNEEFDSEIKSYINSNADAKTANGGDDTVSAQKGEPKLPPDFWISDRVRSSGRLLLLNEFPRTSSGVNRLDIDNITNRITVFAKRDVAAAQAPPCKR